MLSYIVKDVELHGLGCVVIWWRMKIYMVEDEDIYG
jgi:hypothetical protein